MYTYSSIDSGAGGLFEAISIKKYTVLAREKGVVWESESRATGDRSRDRERVHSAE